MPGLAVCGMRLVHSLSSLDHHVGYREAQDSHQVARVTCKWAQGLQREVLEPRPMRLDKRLVMALAL
jgi:hypothetical protein